MQWLSVGPTVGSPGVAHDETAASTPPSAVLPHAPAVYDRHESAYVPTPGDGSLWMTDVVQAKAGRLHDPPLLAPELDPELEPEPEELDPELEPELEPELVLEVVSAPLSVEGVEPDELHAVAAAMVRTDAEPKARRCIDTNFSNFPELSMTDLLSFAVRIRTLRALIPVAGPRALLPRARRPWGCANRLG